MPLHSEDPEFSQGMTLYRVVDLLRAIASRPSVFRPSHLALELNLSRNVVTRYLRVFQIKGLVEDVSKPGSVRAEWFKTIPDQRVKPTPTTMDSAGSRIALFLDLLQCVRDANYEPIRNKDVSDALGIPPSTVTNYLQALCEIGIIRPYGKSKYCVNWSNEEEEENEKESA